MRILDLMRFKDPDINFYRDEDLINLIHDLNGDNYDIISFLDQLKGFDVILFSGHPLIAVALFRLSGILNFLFPVYKKEKGERRSLIGFYTEEGKFLDKDDVLK